MFWLESPNIPVNQLNQLLLPENRDGFKHLSVTMCWDSNRSSWLQYLHSHFTTSTWCPWLLAFIKIRQTRNVSQSFRKYWLQLWGLWYSFLLRKMKDKNTLTLFCKSTSASPPLSQTPNYPLLRYPHKRNRRALTDVATNVQFQSYPEWNPNNAAPSLDVHARRQTPTENISYCRLSQNSMLACRWHT